MIEWQARLNTGISSGLQPEFRFYPPNSSSPLTSTTRFSTRSYLQVSTHPSNQQGRRYCCFDWGRSFPVYGSSPQSASRSEPSPSPCGQEKHGNPHARIRGPKRNRYGLGAEHFAPKSRRLTPHSNSTAYSLLAGCLDCAFGSSSATVHQVSPPTISHWLLTHGRGRPAV